MWLAALAVFLFIAGGGGLWALTLRPEALEPVAAALPAPVVVEPAPPVTSAGTEPAVAAASTEPVVTSAPTEPAVTSASTAPAPVLAPVSAPVVERAAVAAVPPAAAPKPTAAAKPTAAPKPAATAKVAAAPKPAATPSPATKPEPPLPAVKPAVATADAAKPVAAPPRPTSSAPAPVATAVIAPTAASFLDDLSVDVTGTKVVLTGTMSGVAVRPWHYLSQDAGPDGATRYVIKLKGTANRGGVKRLPVAAPGVRGVSVQQDAAGLVLVVDCDCSDERPVQMSKLADGFQLAIPTN